MVPRPAAFELSKAQYAPDKSLQNHQPNSLLPLINQHRIIPPIGLNLKPCLIRHPIRIRTKHRINPSKNNTPRKYPKRHAETHVRRAMYAQHFRNA